ncbi:MAG: Bro-N domain-containing protein [Nanoarchaeota archaeon]
MKDRAPIKHVSNKINENSLETFYFLDKYPVRVKLINDEPWFVGKDVCEILELSNTSQALQGLDEDEKGIYNVYTLGGNQDLSIINESGLYSLTFTSRKPGAKKFKKWVTSEVLPAIRKTGGYIKVNQGDSDADIMAKALLIATKTIEEKDRRIAEEITKRGQISTAREASVMGKLSAANKNLKQIRDIIDPILDSKVEMTARQQVNALARLYAQQNGIDHKDIWGEIYSYIYYTESINIRLRSANAGYKNKLEYVEDKHPELLTKMINFMENKFLEKLN